MQASSFDALEASMADEMLKTGIKGLDRDHRAVFEEFLMIQDNMENFRLGKATEADWQAIAKLLAQLEKHTKHHFAGEEAYLEKIGSIHLEDHKNQHREFSKRVQAYKQVLDKRDEKQIFGLKYDLFNWLCEHINVMDSEIDPDAPRLPTWKNPLKGQSLFPFDLKG